MTISKQITKFKNLLPKINPIFIKTFLGVFLVAVLIYKLFLPIIISGEKLNNLIQNKLSPDYSLHIENLDTAFSFKLKLILNADNILLKEKYTDKIILNTDKTTVKIPILSLILQNANNLEIITKDTNANIERDKNNLLNIKKAFKTSSKSPKKIDFKLKIKNYDIKFYDFEETPIFLEGDVLELNTIKKYNLKTRGLISKNDKYSIINIDFSSKKPFKSNKIKLKGTINNLDFGLYEKYIKELNPNITKCKGFLDGDFNINTTKNITNNLNAKINSTDIIISTKKHPNLIKIAQNAQIVSTGTKRNHKIYLKNFRIISQQYNFEATGTIKNTNLKNKKLNLQIKTSNSSLEDLLNVIPKNLHIKYNAVNKLLKSNAKGILSANLKITHRTKNPYIYGDVSIKDFSILNNPQYSSIFASFNKKNLNLNIIFQDKDKNQLNIKGQNKLGKNAKLNMEIKSNQISSKFFLENLSFLSNMFNFSTGIINQLTFYGPINLDLYISGHGENTNVFGKIGFINTFLNYEKLSKEIHLKNSFIEFEKRKILFNKTPFDINSYEGLIDGYATFNNNYDINLSFNNFPAFLGLDIIKNSQLTKNIAKKIEPINFAAGMTSSQIHISKIHHYIDTKELISGTLKCHNAVIGIENLYNYIEKINGEIVFDKDNLFSKNLTGAIFDGISQIDIKINKGHLVSNILTKNAKVQETLISLEKSSIFKQLNNLFEDAKGSGNYDFQMLLDNTDSSLFKNIEIKNLNGAIENKHLPIKINFKNGCFFVDKNTFIIKNMPFSTNSSKGIIEGNIKNLSNKPEYNLDISFENLSGADIQELKDKNFSPLLKQFNNFSGNARGHLSIKEQTTGNIHFKDFRANYIPYKLPILIKSGEIKIQNKHLYCNNIPIQIGTSNYRLSCSGENTPKIELEGNLTPFDLDYYFNKNLKYPLNLRQKTPIKVILSSFDNNSFEITIGALLNNYNFISYKGASIGSPSHSYIIGGKLKHSPSELSFENFGINKYNSLPPFDINSIKDNKNYFKLNGNINTKNQNMNLKIYAKEFMDINLFNEFLEEFTLFNGGTFKGDLKITGNYKSPKIAGEVELNNCKIPAYKTTIHSLKMIFEPKNIIFQNGNLKIDKYPLYFSAIGENFSTIPFIFKELNVNMPDLNVDEISKIFLSSPKNKTKPTKTIKTPLFIVKNGTIKTNHFELGNISGSDFKSEFSFSPKWILTLQNYSLKSAGGEVVGNSQFNFLNLMSTTSMKLKNIDANAVSTTLLQMPNELYGLLNGNMDITTKGTSTKDIIKNMNGTGRFHITSGRLVRMGSLEYLLTTAEVLKSGITGLSLNNIWAVLAAQKTGNFDTINVNFKIKDGVLFTDDLISRSEKLNIYMAGNFDMTTNYADFTILGKVSKSVVSILGPIGKISINKVISTIGGDALNEYVPSLIKLIGVDLNNKNFRRFVVNIEGNLYDHKSVKNFRWID